MPRKSASLRLSQSQELLANYTEAGMAESYQGRFITDMINRFNRSKGLSKKQRDWLDNLIEEGVPTPKGDPSTISKIDAALAAWANNVDREWESKVITDFKGRLNRGYDLSEKQAALMAKLLEKASDDISGVNLFTPTEEQLSDLQALTKIYGSYAPQWRAERPAVSRAVQRVTAFLCGEGTIEAYHYEKLCKSMGAKLRNFKNPRFAEGALGWISIYDRETRRSIKHPATALTNAYISDRGEIVNDWFENGKITTVAQQNVNKRR